MKKTIILIIILITLSIAWLLISPLFVNQSVDEEVPVLVTDVSEEPENIPVNQNDQDNGDAGILQELNETEENFDTEDDIIIGNDIVVQESMPEMLEMSIETRGSFQGADARHQGSGELKVIKDGDKTFLRFEDFSVTNGPDLFVSLNKGNSPEGEHVLISSLKGNVGNQNYDVSDYDIDAYESVSIYCRAFSVEFATASL